MPCASLGDGASIAGYMCKLIYCVLETKEPTASNQATSPQVIPSPPHDLSCYRSLRSAPITGLCSDCVVIQFRGHCILPLSRCPVGGCLSDRLCIESCLRKSFIIAEKLFELMFYTICGIFLLAFLSFWYIQTHAVPLPGPRQYPIIGNMLTVLICSSENCSRIVIERRLFVRLIT